MSQTLYAHWKWLLCTAAATAVGLALLGGCPPTTTDDGNTADANSATDPNTGGNTGGDPNTGGNTGGDPNAGGNTGGDPNTGGNTGGDPNTGGNTGGDPNTSGNTGGDPNTGGNTGGDPNTGGGTTPTPPPTSIVLTKIAQTGDYVPGQPTGVTFKEFGAPVIDSKGRVAFWATYQGGGARGYGGLYLYDGNSLSRILDDDPNTAGVVPERSGRAAYFGRYGGTGGTSPISKDLAWGGGDRLVFVSDIYGANILDDSVGVYRWKATDGSIARVADRELMMTIFTDVNNSTLVPTFTLPGISDGGIAVFGMSYFYFDMSSNYVSGKGVFRSLGTSTSAIADTRIAKTVPGQDDLGYSTAYFYDVDQLTTLTPEGDILFGGSYSNGNGTVGVYLRRGSTNYYVIDNRSAPAWPGLPSGTQFRSPGGTPKTGTGSGGQFAVDGRLFLTTVRDAVILWDFDTSTWAEITGPSGAAATSLVSGVSENGEVLILANANPYVATRTSRIQVNATLPAALQGATLTWRDAGGSINNHGRAVVPYNYASGDLGLAFWTGEQLLVVADATLDIPGDLSSLATVTDPRRDRPGRSGMLNDADEIVFRATLKDAIQALYIARGQ